MVVYNNNPLVGQFNQKRRPPDTDEIAAEMTDIPNDQTKKSDIYNAIITAIKSKCLCPSAPGRTDAICERPHPPGGLGLIFPEMIYAQGCC